MKELLMNFPLKELYKTPSPKRAKRAILRLRRILAKRYHVDENSVYISQKINETVWAKGFEKVPRMLELRIVVDEKRVKAYLKDEKEEVKEGEKKIEKRAKEEKEEKEVKKEEHKQKKEKSEKEKKEEKRKLEEKKAREKAAEHASRKK